MSKSKDIYEMWQDTGQLPQVLEFIKDCSKKLITQKEMCEYLKVSEVTFIKIKRKHPEIEKAMYDARLNLKCDLASAMYKKALGYELVDEEQFIEDRGKGQEQKRKIHRTKKQVGPDYKAIVYLLVKQFGREYSDKNDDYELMERKLLESKEVWIKSGEAPKKEMEEDDESEFEETDNL